MPQVNIEATRAAARALGRGETALSAGRPEISTAPVASVLRGSSTAALLAPIQTQARLRLGDAAAELGTLQEALTTLADNVETATGGAP